MRYALTIFVTFAIIGLIVWLVGCFVWWEWLNIATVDPLARWFGLCGTVWATAMCIMWRRK